MGCLFVNVSTKEPADTGQPKLGPAEERERGVVNSKLNILVTFYPTFINESVHY